MAHDSYDYKVIHRPGKDHRNADALSCLMCTWNHSKAQEDKVVTFAVKEEASATQVKDLQNDPQSSSTNKATAVESILTVEEAPSAPLNSL